MSRDWFVFPNNRLGSVDVIVPVLYEIKLRYPDVRIWIVFMEDRAYTQLTRDSFLMNTVENLSYRIVRVRIGSYGFLIRLVGMVSFFPVLNAMIVKTGYTLLHSRGVASLKMKILSRICRVRYGRFLEYPKQHVPIFPRLVDVRFKGEEGDGYLCFSAKDVPFLRETGRNNVFPIGYPRMFASWLAYVYQAATTYVSNEVPGELDNDVIAVFLGSTVEGIFGLDEQRMWIITVISELRRVLPSSWILIKPHPTSDPEALAAILEEVGDTRSLLTYLHPSLLAAKSCFVIARHSSTIVDGLAAGRRVILYQKFTRSWMKFHPEKSIYPQLGAELAENSKELRYLVSNAINATEEAVDVSSRFGHVENIELLVN